MRKRAIAAAILLAMTLAGCSESVLNPADGTDSADGQYSEWAPADRSAPVDFATTTSTGAPVTSSALRGKIVVLNFWYAACGPCRIEAKTLEAVHEEYPKVAFIGVNTRDGASEVAAFDKNYGITYPSVLDSSTGNMLLAFSSSKPANSTPTTIVLDEQGRPAARVLGSIGDKSILSDMLDKVIAESHG